MPYNRVYLAGPDVFYPDATERAARLKDLCQQNGLEGVFPLDSQVKLLEPFEQEDNGFLIYHANVKLIKSCWAMLANMNPFRGPSMDVGTAFEIGYGRALELHVVGYTDSKTEYKTRVKEDGLVIENFGMVDNLMVHAAVCGDIFESVEEAIEYLGKLFTDGEPTKPIDRRSFSSLMLLDT
jgi:nucleoside 2-deoxyribosyltransferase